MWRFVSAAMGSDTGRGASTGTAVGAATGTATGAATDSATGAAAVDPCPWPPWCLPRGPASAGAAAAAAGAAVTAANVAALAAGTAVPGTATATAGTAATVVAGAASTATAGTAATAGLAAPTGATVATAATAATGAPPSAALAPPEEASGGGGAAGRRPLRPPLPLSCRPSSSSEATLLSLPTLSLRPSTDRPHARTRSTAGTHRLSAIVASGILLHRGYNTRTGRPTNMKQGADMENGRGAASGRRKKCRSA